MTETIAIILSVTCVAIILLHCALYAWLKNLEARDDNQT
jgi:hypothetical protein